MALNKEERAIVERLLSLISVGDFHQCYLAEHDGLIAEARATLAGLEDERQWPDASHGYDSRDAMLLHNFREVLEEIAGSTNLTATPDQFAAHLQRTARNALIAARVKR